MTNNVCKPSRTEATNQANRVLETFFNRPVNEFIHEKNKRNSPVYANIEELSDRFQIYLAIPGYDKSNVSINLEKNKITVSGSKEADTSKKNLLKEFDYKSFERSFYLPEDVQYDKIEANIENGVLKISILKAEVKAPIKVSVK